MEIREAIEHISKSNAIIAFGAKEALTNENHLIMFVNQITEQASETPLNKERLISMFGKEVIETILDFNLRKSVEQGFITMNKCIEGDLKDTK